MRSRSDRYLGLKTVPQFCVTARPLSLLDGWRGAYKVKLQLKLDQLPEEQCTLLVPALSEAKWAGFLLFELRKRPTADGNK